MKLSKTPTSFPRMRGSRMRGSITLWQTVRRMDSRARGNDGVA
jgi:hypothetical protein